MASPAWAPEQSLWRWPRARYINYAITFATVGGFSTALVVALLFVSTFVPMNLATSVAVLFVFAMASLLAAFLSFLIEIRIAVAALRIGGA